MGGESSSINLKPKFKAEKSKDGSDPLKITFTDTSDMSLPNSVPMFYKWDFGDGSPNDNTKNPVHSYGKAGSYFVQFWTAVKPNEWVTVPAAAYVDVVLPTVPATKPAAPTPAPSTPAPAPPTPKAPAPPAPVPAPVPAPAAPAVPAVPAVPKPSQPGQLVPKFNVYQTQGGDTATFVFKDASDGAVQYWSWDFGDNAGNSTDQSPTYKFKTSGTYTVHMFVSNDEFRKQNGPDAWLSASTKIPVTVAATKEGFGSVVNMDWIIWLIVILIIIAIIYGKC